MKNNLFFLIYTLSLLLTQSVLAINTKTRYLCRTSFGDDLTLITNNSSKSAFLFLKQKDEDKEWGKTFYIYPLNSKIAQNYLEFNLQNKAFIKFFPQDLNEVKEKENTDSLDPELTAMFDLSHYYPNYSGASGSAVCRKSVYEN